MTSPRLTVARISKAQGLRGEVALEVRTDIPEERLAVGAVLDTEPAGRGPLTIAQPRVEREVVRAARRCRRPDRRRGPAWRVELVVDADESDEEDARYVHELAYLRAELEDGDCRRHRQGPEHLPAHDVLVVEEVDGARTLVPFVTAIVPTVDVPGGRVVPSRRPAASSLVTPRTSTSRSRSRARPRSAAESAYRRRLDLPGVPRRSRPLPGRQGPHRRPADLRVHDLRDWTTDRHPCTVDDTSAGGGAGMVMSGRVGRGARRSPDERATLVVPTPSGPSFTQRTAEDPRRGRSRVRVRALRGHRRVAEHYREAGVRVEEASIGDYVLNGGEVAALVMVEAVARLLPGVLGNPESVVEESHSQAGLLEYPVYTKPPHVAGPRGPCRRDERAPRQGHALASGPGDRAYSRATSGHGGRA